MVKTLTDSEMLEIWRRARADGPLRLDCTVDRTDGPDVDAILTDEMRAWYLSLLDSAPVSRLALCNNAELARINAADDGILMLTAPAGCRRIISVFFDGWNIPVSVEPRHALPSSLRNPFCRRPRAFALAPDRIAVIGASGKLKEMNCAMDISDKVYIFDDSALNDIPKSQL